ncbi:MAG: hypothetical protein JKY50_00065 [Oleispira sp.]|nr:hypothetical protein [Oleispira sp.]
MKINLSQPIPLVQGGVMQMEEPNGKPETVDMPISKFLLRVLDSPREGKDSLAVGDVQWVIRDSEMSGETETELTNVQLVLIQDELKTLEGLPSSIVSWLINTLESK